MLIGGDISDFCAVVDEVRERLARLNNDGSLDGLLALFERLLNELPPDFFECEPVSTVPAAGVDPLPTVIIRAGSRLNALAAALRAFDLDVEPHDSVNLSTSA